MHPVRITAKLSVAKQPAVEDFSALAAAGFTAIINNRPDGEEEAQPGSAAEQHAAQAAGLAYSHIPVTGPSITEADVRRFQSAVAGATGPVLGHLRRRRRTPTRSWAMSRSKGWKLSGSSTPIRMPTISRPRSI
jgi:uncharacterized protein (TIGR01244 family)